jgi:hypothetical protein
MRNALWVMLPYRIIAAMTVTPISTLVLLVASLFEVTVMAQDVSPIDRTSGARGAESVSVSTTPKSAAVQVGQLTSCIAGKSGFGFIDTSIENASPVWYEFLPDETILVHLLYDHERASANRAAGHINILIHAAPGSRLMLEFTNLDNVWNGQPGSVAKELKTVVISANGRDWTTVATQSLPENRVRLAVEMPGPQLYVARIEPYRLSDLDRLLCSIRHKRLVQITTIGKTVQGRNLELIRIGRPRASNRVFIRARAHPWESGGNWVVEGLIHRLLQGDAEARAFMSRYSVYIMPLANKDGVARGMTRFNLEGKDLNRDWDKTADARFAPENAALEGWLEKMIRAGKSPRLALELHNDSSGLLHLSRPATPELNQYLARMSVLEALLRRHTWFTEGSTKPSFQNSGTLGEGWLERYGIDAVVHEFNCNWIAGIGDYPSAQHWRDYGAKLAAVFYEYFGPNACSETRAEDKIALSPR